MKTDTERQAEDADGFDIGAIAEELGVSVKAESGGLKPEKEKPEVDGDQAEPGEAAEVDGETDESRQDGDEEAAEESAEESEDG